MWMTEICHHTRYIKDELQHTPRHVVCQIVDGDVMNIVDAGQINPQGGSL